MKILSGEKSPPDRDLNPEIPESDAITTFGIVALVKGKSVPLQAWSGPKGSKKLRFPDFMTTVQGGGKIVSLTHPPPLPPGNSPGTHFCWRLIRPKGHSAIGRIVSMKNSNETIWNRTNDLPICSTARRGCSNWNYKKGNKQKYSSVTPCRLVNTCNVQTFRSSVGSVIRQYFGYYAMIAVSALAHEGPNCDPCGGPPPNSYFSELKGG